MDNCIPPSWLELGSIESIGDSVRRNTDHNFSLMAGFVVARKFNGEVIDKKEYKQSSVLYDVVVEMFEPTSAKITPVIVDCELSVLLGSNADQARYSIRTPNGWDGKKLTKEIKEQSSRVLILCRNGMTNHGIIIGFLPNNKAEIESKELGHNSFHSFNGIETRVNKDGEYVLTFTGQTIDDQNKVQPKDDAKAGTFLKLTKEGNIVLSDTRGEVLTIDNTNKKVTLEARAQETNITDGNWKLEVKGDVKIHATGNVSVDSDKKVFIGGESASENLMLGKKTLTALKKLVDTFTNSPMIGNLGSPNGPPVILNQAIAVMLQQWKLQNCVPATSPLLAKKKFTE